MAFIPPGHDHPTPEDHEQPPAVRVLPGARPLRGPWWHPRVLAAATLVMMGAAALVWAIWRLGDRVQALLDPPPTATLTPLAGPGPARD